MPNYSSSGNVLAQASDPGAIGAGSYWADTDANTTYRRNDANTAWVEFQTSVGLTSLRTDATLTSGEALSTNQLVMIDAADNTVYKCTSAKAAQAIGVMLQDVAITTAFTYADMATYGIVTFIAGAAITRGDRLTCDTGTAGRVITLNSYPTHSHTAFTCDATGETASTDMTAITSGAGTAMGKDSWNSPVGLVRGTAVFGGADALTCVTSSTAAATTGTVVGKALESAAGAGSTFRGLLCLTG